MDLWEWRVIEKCLLKDRHVIRGYIGVTTGVIKYLQLSRTARQSYIQIHMNASCCYPVQ